MGDILKQADVFYRKHNWAKAVNLYLEAKQANEGDYELYANKLADAMNKSGNPEEASLLLLELAKEVYKNGKISKTLSLLRQSIAINNEEFRSRMELAKILDEEGFKWDAIKEKKEILHFYLKRKAFHHAIKITNEIYEESKNDINILSQKMDCLEGLGLWHELSILVKDTFDENNVISLNEKLIENNLTNQTLTNKLEYILQKFPNDPILLGVRARILLLEGNYRECIRLIGKAFRFMPERLDTLETLAAALLKVNEKRKAMFVVNYITERMGDDWLENPAFIQDLGWLQEQGIGSAQEKNKTKLVALDDVITDEDSTKTEKDTGEEQEDEVEFNSDNPFNLEDSPKSIKDSVNWKDIKDLEIPDTGFLNDPGDDLLEGKTEVFNASKWSESDINYALSQARTFFEDGILLEAKKICKKILLGNKGEARALKLLKKIRDIELDKIENKSSVKFFERIVTDSPEVARERLLKSLNISEEEISNDEFNLENADILFLVDQVLETAKQSDSYREKIDLVVLLHEMGFYEEALHVIKDTRKELEGLTQFTEEQEKRYLNLTYFIIRINFSMGKIHQARKNLEQAKVDSRIDVNNRDSLYKLLSHTVFDSGN